MNDVRTERTGWRDNAISLRHRQWGFNCPATDLDFLMCEFNYSKPVALIEYKHKNADLCNMLHPTRNALCALCDGYKDGPLPCFVAVYCNEDWWFKIIPLNDAARKIYSTTDRCFLTEKRFVASLHWLRKMTLTESDKTWFDKLNDVPPPVNVESLA
jgi:hypothetical protein